MSDQVCALVIVSAAGLLTYALGEWITRRSSARWFKDTHDRMRGK